MNQSLSVASPVLLFVRRLWLAGPAVLMLTFMRAAPMPAQDSRFDSGTVLGADWLQANALPMNRNALQSNAITVDFRETTWSVDVGWLRVARSLSTVQGGTVSIARLVQLGPVLVIPSVGAFGGAAQASEDTTGYNYLSTAGLPGHVARYSYSQSASAGGGAMLTIEVPIWRNLGFRAEGSEWVFSGAPLAGNRQRALLGAGLDLRVGRNPLVSQATSSAKAPGGER
jgi:hypothetical protein